MDHVIFLRRPWQQYNHVTHVSGESTPIEDIPSHHVWLAVSCGKLSKWCFRYSFWASTSRACSRHVTIVTAYRSGIWRWCELLQWCFVGLLPQAYALTERPASCGSFIQTIICSFTHFLNSIKLKISVNAAQEVVLQTAKSIHRPSAALHIW